MTRQATPTARLAATVLRARVRAGAAAAIPAPYLVLDLGCGRDPHQARCRRCRWRSGWRATAAQVQADYARHQAATHRHGRPNRRGRLGLVPRRRGR